MYIQVYDTIFKHVARNTRSPYRAYMRINFLSNHMQIKQQLRTLSSIWAIFTRGSTCVPYAIARGPRTHSTRGRHAWKYVRMSTSASTHFAPKNLTHYSPLSNFSKLHWSSAQKMEAKNTRNISRDQVVTEFKLR